MFDPEKWVQKAWNDADNTKTVTIAGEEVKIRRLNGTQWESYIRALHGKGEDSSVVLALQYGLVKGFGQYTYEQMAKFYDTNPVLADKVVQAIIEHTAERMAAENKVLEDAEKNSETTTTPPPSGDGAESMVETHNPQQ
jgi:hypothetical protein